MNMEHAKQLLSLFYAHKLHIDEACMSCNEPSKAMMHLCSDIVKCLKMFSLEEIIEIVKPLHVPFPIDQPDIPQFSDFNLAVYRTPYLAYASNCYNIPYKDMGYMLLQGARRDVAYQKYGENQSKTAAMLGLCSIMRGKVNVSYLGVYFCNLSDEEQKLLLPKLMLYVPIVQNYFLAGRNESLLEEYLSLLADTTRKRRIGNLNTMIQTVEKQLVNEL
jgi:hypothetical protein